MLRGDEHRPGTLVRCPARKQEARGAAAIREDSAAPEVRSVPRRRAGRHAHASSRPLLPSNHACCLSPDPGPAGSTQAGPKDTSYQAGIVYLQSKYHHQHSVRASVHRLSVHPGPLPRVSPGHEPPRPGLPHFSTETDLTFEVKLFGEKVPVGVQTARCRSLCLGFELRFRAEPGWREKVRLLGIILWLRSVVSMSPGWGGSVTDSYVTSTSSPPLSGLSLLLSTIRAQGG